MKYAPECPAIIPVVLLFLSTACLNAQWEQRYPPQNGYSISDFVFIDGKRGLYSTYEGVIQRTEDSGRSWQVSSCIKVDKLLAISFADSDYGIAYSPYAYLNDTTSLLVTSDGGTSWAVSSALHWGSLVINTPQKAELLCVNHSVALATFEDGNIQQSVDQMRSWNVVWQNRYFFPSDYGIPYGWISSFYRLANGAILAVGNNLNAYQYGVITDSVSYILKSTDNGGTWGMLWSGSKEVMRAVSFSDSLTGWMCGDSGIYHSTDGGLSWRSQERPVLGGPPIASIAAIDSLTVYAADMYGDFYSSTDGGITWSIPSSFPSSSGTKIQFLTKNVGYGGGRWGLYKTTDGGLHWIKQTGEYLGNLARLAFLDDRVGYSIVNYSLYKTTTSGYSWSSLSEGYAFHAVDSSDLWMTKRDTVLHSVNGGITWTKIHFDSAYINNVYFFDRDFGLLYDVWDNPDSYASIATIVTLDGGMTWTRYRLPNPLYGMRKLLFVSRQEGWFDSQEGLFHTTDGGQTWQVILQDGYGNPWNQNAFSFDFVDSNNGWFAYYGFIYTTTDGGKTWTHGDLPFSAEIKDIKFIGRRIGYVVGQYGVIFSTTDGGISWQMETQCDPYDLTSISVSRLNNTMRVRIGGNGFTILAKDIVTAVGEHENRLPTDYFLSQNYPDPFNPSTSISFSVSKLSHIRLQIFNVLGQLLETLVDQAKPPGTYTVMWDAGERPSGLYFYRMTSGGFAQTRKAILMR